MKLSAEEEVRLLRRSSQALHSFCNFSTFTKSTNGGNHARSIPYHAIIPLKILSSTLLIQTTTRYQSWQPKSTANQPPPSTLSSSTVLTTSTTSLTLPSRLLRPRHRPSELQLAALTPFEHSHPLQPPPQERVSRLILKSTPGNHAPCAN